MAAKSYDELVGALKQKSQPAPTKDAGNTSVSSGSSYNQLLTKFHGGEVAPVQGTVKLGPAKPASVKAPEPAAPKPLQTGGSLEFTKSDIPTQPTATRSTSSVPTQAQVEATGKVIDTVKQKAAATVPYIQNILQEKKSSKNELERWSASAEDALIEQGKSLTNSLYKLGQSFAPIIEQGGVNSPKLSDKDAKNVAVGSLNAGIQIAMNRYYGLVDFATGALPETARFIYSTTPVAKVTESISPEANTKIKEGIQGAAQWGVDTIFNKILGGAGSAVADVGADVFNLNEEQRQQLREAGSLAFILGGFHAAASTYNGVQGYKRNTAAKVDSVSMLKPMADVLDVNTKMNKNGTLELPNETELLQRFESKVKEVSDSNVPFSKARQDVYTTAYKMLLDYSRSPDKVGFKQRWDGVVDQAVELGDRLVQESAKHSENLNLENKARQVNEIVNKPATKETLALVNRLEPDARLAFEQEIVRMNGENDPNLNKKANEQGYSYQRINDPNLNRPADFDPITGEIRLNEPIINKTLDSVWRGDALRVGEGATTSVFRKIEGESFEQMKKRYEDTLLRHEIAHAETITPEESAKLKVLFETDKQAYEKARLDLEDRANKYMVEKSSKLDEELTRAVERKVQEHVAAEERASKAQSLKFQEPNKETAYREWRRSVQDNPSREATSWKEYSSSLEGNKRGNLTRASIEDASKGSTPNAILDEFRARLKEERQLVADRQAARERIANERPNPLVEKAYKTTRQLERALETEKKLNREQRIQLLRERITRRLEQDVLKEKFNEAKAKIQEKINNKREAQQLLVDYMREFKVPKDVRAKYLTELKNVKNPAEVSAIVDSINKDWNEFNRKKMRGEVYKMLEDTRVKRSSNGSVQGKMTADAQELVDKARKYSKLSRNEINQKIIELVDKAKVDVKEGNPFELPQEIVKEIQALELGGVKDASVSQLERIKAQLQEIIDTGKSERQLSDQRLRDRITRVKENIYEQLTGKKQLPKETQADLKVKKQSKFKDWMDAASPFGNLTRRVGGAFHEWGKQLSSSIDRAGNEFQQTREGIDQFMKKNYQGKDSLLWDSWEKELHDIQTVQHDLGEMRLLNGEMTHVRATRGMAMDLYMKMQNPKNVELHIMNGNGNGYTPEIVKAITDLLTDADKRMADHLIEQGYQPLWEKMNERFSEDNGVKLGYEERYSGQRRFKNAKEEGVSISQMPEDILNGYADYLMSTKPGFTKSASARSGEMNFSNNPIADFLTYASKAHTYIEAGRNLREGFALFKDQDFRKVLENTHGRALLDQIQWHMKNFAEGSFKMAADTQTKVLDKWQNNLKKALLAKPSVAISQTAALFNFKGEASILGGKAKDFWSGVVNAKKNAALVMEHSPALKARLRKSTSESMRRYIDKPSTFDRATDKISETALSLMEKTDAFTSLRGASGIFEQQSKHYMEKGLSQERAYELAGRDVDDVINRSQSTHSMTGKLGVEGGALRYFVQLKQEPIKLTNSFIEVARMTREGRLTPKQAASWYAWSWIVQNSAYSLLRHGTKMASLYLGAQGAKALGFTGLADKQEEKLKKSGLDAGLQDAALNVITSPLQAPLIGDVITTAIQNTAFGKNFTPRPALLQALTDDVLKSITNIANGKPEPGAIEAIRFISRSVGLPDPLDLLTYAEQSASQSAKDKAAAAKKEEKFTPEGFAKKMQTKANNREKKFSKLK